MSNGIEQEADTQGAPAVWRQPWQIHSYDVDFRKRATVSAICRTFLEAAWNHAEKLGFGFGDLARQNKLWVLARLLVQCERPLKWGERVELSTWPRGASGLFALRDFVIGDGAGNRASAGTSSWLVLDTQNHRPQRLEKLAFRLPNHPAGGATDREARKLTDVHPGTPSLTTAVRYSDLDVNDHVNSATYVTWLLDAYTREFHRNHRLRSLEINYTGETRSQDKVSVLTHQRTPLEFTHRVLRSDSSEACRAELLWAVDPSDASTPD